MASSSSASATLGPPLRGPALSSELTQIKIRLRGDAEKRRMDRDGQYSAHKRRRVEHDGNGSRAGNRTGTGHGTDGAADERDQRYFGRDDVTIRFLWDVGDQGAEAEGG